MFTKEFSLEQRIAACKMCYRMIVADHRVRETEHEILDDIELLMGLRGKVSREDLAIAPDLAVFDTDQSRVAVMLQLFAVAFADRQIHDDELEILRRYAHTFGLSAEKFEEIATWGRRHSVLFEQARDIINV
ncbi:hypothetical protein MTBLM5_110001 [Magnetospirillum sp. LM-5]|uniref:TerB family tellurite resistance protein n=1 Tax=Magnetospirillum sp. LM-5 TaxID=2681466 RepID=UPI00137E973D|nr:TerB family tellurite resistance protein [Magnetospirillum sp. LM-5]CAA7613247.1 hypothetical protein MTBLM5_110001 [Magnetospirillum sp. LM-5]